MKRFLFVWAALLCITLWGCSWGSAHQHTFGNWVTVEYPSCAREGVEERVCDKCQQVESRPVAKLPHELNTYNMCLHCKYVDFDPEADFAELGVFNKYWYKDNTVASQVWDVKIQGDKVYLGAGDYGENSGATPILAFNKVTRRWFITGTTADEAIHRFVDIGGTLYAPGIDPTGSWELGNFYVLEGEKWKQVRNLPGGIHNFDMIEFDGNIFAGLGTETLGDTVAISEDGGETFRFIPLYQDGEPFDTDGYEFSRTYEFVTFGGRLYALVALHKDSDSWFGIFCYEDGKMVYQANADGLLMGTPFNRNYWNGKLEKDGVCYLTAGSLFAVTDFADPSARQKVAMPGDERVVDTLLYDNVIYILCYKVNQDLSGCTTVIYQSATGQAGSFTEVARYEYPALPSAFDYDGTHFYIGTGDSKDNAKAGMLLRIKA